MNPRKCIFLLPLLITPSLPSAEPIAEIPPTPQFRIEETVVSYRDKLANDYVAFPAILRTGDREILLSYKRGYAHARDPGAVLEIIRFDLEKGRPNQDPIRIGMSDRVMQMGEWIRFPNGTLGTFIDAHVINEKNKHIRIGLRYALSEDNGKTFGPLKSVGVVDGVEYGYLFDSVTIGKRLYALIMTFEYLAGGRRTVDALYTEDNGETWNFIRNLSEEFGNISINESGLIPYKDGFIVVTRGYDSMARLHRVDKEFNLIKETNLTEITHSITSYVGRPRLFEYGGAYFLIGRNRRSADSGTRMELGLMRIDPESLTVDKQFVLDNVEQGKVTDGYYPFPILVESGGRTLLNVFDYRAILGNSPDIIRLQFDSAVFLE
ncbi:MAG: sialidase family protein [Opitutales bacterium]|nr:sialidase family protein [Opitutales bacterium]